MNLRRLCMKILSYNYRFIFVPFRYRRLHLVMGFILVIYLLIFLFSQMVIIEPNPSSIRSSPSTELYSQQTQTKEQNNDTLNNSKNHEEIIQTSPVTELYTQQSQTEVQNNDTFNNSKNHEEIIQSSPGAELYTQQSQTIEPNNDTLNNSKPHEKNFQTSLAILLTKFTRPLIRSNRTVPHDKRLLYSFVDIDHLDVDINYLDEKYQPPEELNIDLPSPDSHPLSRILNVKGDGSTILYNRIPQCYEFTMNSLLLNISYLHSYKYVPSTIYIPFNYNESSLLSIAKSLTKHKYDRLIYERHIYFFDFYKLQMPTHPIWINLVRDPIYRVAAEYNRSREVCQKTNRCFVDPNTINDTLDDCVRKRNPRDCISPFNGVSRMLPFFCGSTYPFRCLEETEWALNQAKQNIDFYYTVIGFAEEFYKFLYVLEKLLPQYFKLARLLFMNQHDPKILADERDIDVIRPNETTINILKPLLKYEYRIYDHIKQRFYDQYRILADLDN